jgi:hypothetical protein
MIVSGFDSFRSSPEPWITSVSTVRNAAGESPSDAIPADKAAEPETSALARDLAAYSFALRVNDRAWDVLQPVE